MNEAQFVANPHDLRARTAWSVCSIVLVSLMQATAASAQEAASDIQSQTFANGSFNFGGKDSWVKSLRLTPRVLQAKDSTATSLGVGYDLVGKPWSHDYTPSVPIGETPGRQQMASFEFNAKGLYAAREEANTENLVDAAAGGVYATIFNSNPTVLSRTAFNAGYTRQQGNATHYGRWEVSEGLSVALQQFHDIELRGRAAFARIDDVTDEARKAALGHGLGHYQRWQINADVIVPIQQGTLEKFELSQTRFVEQNAPAAIKAAKLSQFKLTTAYLQLQGGFFVAYAKGGLPADRKESQVIQMGWSTNISDMGTK